MTPRSARRVIARGVRKWKRRGNFAKKVNTLISAKIKNTPTPTAIYHDFICSQAGGVSGAGERHWYTWAPGLEVFRRPSIFGGAQYYQEGGAIRLKKWWIKGSIEFNASLANAFTLAQTAVGYVDLYLACNRVGDDVIYHGLPNWYRNGQAALRSRIPSCYCAYLRAVGRHYA